MTTRAPLLTMTHDRFEEATDFAVDPPDAQDMVTELAVEVEAQIASRHELEVRVAHLERENAALKAERERLTLLLKIETDYGEEVQRNYDMCDASRDSYKAKSQAAEALAATQGEEVARLRATLQAVYAEVLDNANSPAFSLGAIESILELALTPPPSTTEQETTPHVR